MNGIGTGPPALVGSGVNTIDGAACTSTGPDTGLSTCLGIDPHALVGSSFSTIDGSLFMPSSIGTDPHALEGSSINAIRCLVGRALANARARLLEHPEALAQPLRSPAPCRAPEGYSWPWHHRLR